VSEGTIAVIPARGGSKGVPRKNLALVAGEPLIVHTIRAARAARTVDRVVVSTDDAEIAETARRAGAEVVLRPARLAEDDSLTEDALVHAIEELGADPEFVVTLEPTSPLRTPELVDACIRLARDRNADTVITVTETRSIYGTLDGEVFHPLREGQARRRQLRSPVYAECSSVYVTRASHLRETRSVVGPQIYALIVPEEQALDVNTPHDLAVADALLSTLRRPI
jgi:CMP-N,N'-diacetyllegionaminic acid synthase